jgi:hypothetical protein
MLGNLEDTRARLADVPSEAIEPVAVLERAEEHRAFWRPANSRVILLAESHVLIGEAELEHVLLPFPGVACIGVGVGRTLRSRLDGLGILRAAAHQP